MLSTVRALLWGLIFGASPVLSMCATAPANTATVVHFDAPALIVAEPIDPGATRQPTTGGQLMRLRLSVSAMIDPHYRGAVEELIVSIDNPSQAMRVLDYWPKTELYSQVGGMIAVQNQSQKNQNFTFAVSGGYEPFARGNATGDYRTQQQVQENYQRRPPMQMLTSSGTVNRGTGVFFKFRPGPTPQLEGDREVALLVEVPFNWRADLLLVRMQATGSKFDPFGKSQAVTLGSTELWTAVHRLGDAQAAAMARKTIASEQALRQMAVAKNADVQQRSMPTVFHKVGAALDIVQPQIPGNYLHEILFNTNKRYFDAMTSKLPVDLRVATLDYWDMRRQLLALSDSSASAAAF